MPKQLGNIILERGDITQAQLGEALRHQMVSGVRIGSALVQIEAVSLDEVGRCLSVHHGVPAADPQLLNHVPPEVLALVPRDLCVQYAVIPFRRDGEAVHLAMRDPTRAVAGEISFRIERPVSRYVVPELRIMYLLERYHAMPRDPRFLRERERNQAAQPAGTASGPTPEGAAPAPVVNREQRTYVEPTVAPDPFIVDEDELEVITLDHHTDYTNRSRTPSQQPEPDELDFDLDIDVEEPVSAETPLDLLLTRLAEAFTSEAVAELLVEPAIAGVDVSLLLWISGRHAVGCRESGLRASPEVLQRLVVPLEHDSLLRRAYQTRSIVAASADRDPLNAKIAAYFNSPPPREVVITPVLFNERVINLLCLWSGTGSAMGDGVVTGAKQLAEAAAVAYAKVAQRLEER